MRPPALFWRGMMGPHHHHRGRGGRGPRGGDFPFGPGGPGGPGPGRGPRARRGDVRAALVLLLEEEPRNGYGLMQEIEQRSDGAWRPSPGSVYPALAQLEDEGLVRVVESEGRKLYELTDAGRAHVEERREQLGTPWEQVSRGWDDEHWQLMDVARQVGLAVMQVASAGTKAQREQAGKVLSDARRALYGILAEDAPRDEDPPQ